MNDEERTSRVRERAYQLFLERREKGWGDALSDWLVAEREIQSDENETRHRGPARLAPHHPHHRTLTDDSGRDVENPA